MFRPSEGRDSLMQLLKLCEDPNLVGSKLLESLTTVPLRDLNCSKTPLNTSDLDKFMWYE